MLGKRQQGILWHRVHRVRSRQATDVESVRSLRILRAGACPKQTLGRSASGRQLQPLWRNQEIPIRFVRLLGNRDTKMTLQSVGFPARNRLIPAADENGRDGM